MIDIISALEAEKEASVCINSKRMVAQFVVSVSMVMFRIDATNVGAL
jgi:hypothetical protein